jgi:hypothetical protein
VLSHGQNNNKQCNTKNMSLAVSRRRTCNHQSHTCTMTTHSQTRILSVTLLICCFDREIARQLHIVFVVFVAFYTM